MDLYLAKRPGSRAPGPAQYLCFSWAALESLSAEDLPAQAWEDFISDEQAPGLISASAAMARGWHFDETGADLTAFEGVSLGKTTWFVKWVLCFLPAHKFIAAVTAAVELHAPKTIYCETAVSPYFRTLLTAAQKDLGTFAVEWIGTEQYGSSPTDWRMPRVSWPLGKRLASKLLSAASRPWRTGAPAMLLSYYSNLQPLIERMGGEKKPFRLVLAELPHRSQAGRLLAMGVEILSSARTEPDWDSEALAALATLRDGWEKAKVKDSHRRKFLWRGVSLLPAVNDTLDRFYREELEPLAWACRQLRRGWRQAPPAMLVLPTDALPVQHLLIDVARLHGTPSVIIVHGLPGDYDLPFEDRQADHLIAWGPEQERLFRAAGRPGHRVLARGNPAFDRYAGSPAHPKERPGGGLLILSNPIVQTNALGRELEPDRYATTIIRTALEAGWTDITFKLHPSESESHYIDLLGPLAGRVRLAKSRPLAGYLEGAAAVIGVFSTALIEAMLLAKPIIYVNMTREPAAPPFDGAWGIPVQRTAADVKARLLELRDDPQGFRAKTIQPYARILEQFVGPLDGASSERVLAFLTSLTSERRR